MQIPNCKAAIVAPEKVLGYLLNLNHTEGRGKALLFMRFGFTTDDYEVLISSLCSVACNEIKDSIITPFGTKYTIESVVPTPDNRNLLLVTVWFIATDTNIPKLVTAYPL
jgi:hypothetical protein